MAGIWGLMAIVQNEAGTMASGGIMAKTEANEKLLGQIISAAAQDRAEALQRQRQLQQQRAAKK